MTDFPNEITSLDQLREHYRHPVQPVLDKVTGVLDDGCRQFIASSTFLLVGTSDTDGNQDVSPRGGPPGFVRVLDERRLVIPDLNGNNRLDSLENIVAHPHVALLFVIPGLGETLRMNGRASITVDDEILDEFTDQLRRPASAIGVVVEEAYIHCAKSLRRGSLWTPEEWPPAIGRPSVGQMLVDHSGAAGLVTAEQVETSLEDAYTEGLAADEPLS
ncbi:MAG: MSMEG_1061 family FMN-dependent PPOX-type flavoprotein [Actinomycetota bacterium]